MHSASEDEATLCACLADGGTTHDIGLMWPVVALLLCLRDCSFPANYGGPHRVQTPITLFSVQSSVCYTKLDLKKT